MSSPTQSAFNPVNTVRVAASTKAGQNIWMSKRKVICWKCQKDFSPKDGRFSFLIKPSKEVKGITSGNSAKKFICFTCKPEEGNEGQS